MPPKVKSEWSSPSQLCKRLGASANNPCASADGELDEDGGVVVLISLEVREYFVGSKSCNAEGPFSLTNAVISSESRSRIARSCAPALGSVTAINSGFKDL